MDFRSQTALDWQRLLSLLSHCATSLEGKESIFTIKVLFDKDAILLLLKEVEEWKRSESLQGKISFDGFKRVNLKAPRGVFLPLESLRSIKEDLKIYIGLRKWIKDDTTNKETLKRFFIEDDNLLKLHKKFEKVFDERGEISDEASPTLFKLRREKEEALERTSNLLKRIMDKFKREYFSQETPTIINGRLVLPVVASKKRWINGIQLDTSSTGSTVYLEPYEAVPFNNTLSDFEAKEKEEIRKILLNLTEEVQSVELPLNKLFDMIVHFDTILARARFGLKYKGISPEISDDCERLRIINGYHPLLMPELNSLREVVFNEKPKKFAVPLNLELSLKKEKTLILSGPNGGGKTVALKTVGLLSMMNQAGIPIPVSEGSIFPIFSKICAVIGDEQSISEDESTFTARMNHIASELKDLKENFLFLVDELNSGTDPMEGSILSREIVKFIHQKKGFLILSTHDDMLKTFAYSTKGMINGAFGYSEEEGKPNYILKMGVIGRSRAFEMAQKAKIPPQIIESAKKEFPEDGVKLSSLIEQFEKKVLEIEEKKNAIIEKENELKILIEEKKREIDAFKEEKIKLLRNLPLEMKKWREEFIKSLKAEVNIQSIRKVSKREIEKRVEIVGRNLGVSDKVEELKRNLYPEIGSFVKIYPLGFEGIVVRIDEAKNSIVLERDGKEISVGIGDVEVIDKEKLRKDEKRGPNIFNKEFVREIMLIGKTVVESIEELDAFLDKAYLEGVEIVRIVHGFGSGRLRLAIRDYLKKDKRIEKFEPAPPNQGGEGATIAKIKGF